MYTCIHVHVCKYAYDKGGNTRSYMYINCTVHVHVHVYNIVVVSMNFVYTGTCMFILRYVQLSKSDDLRVLIARKKGERSAPPTYVTSRRYSLSGSEGENEEEEEGEGEVADGGRKGGLSSVVKIPERHVYIPGRKGSRESA